MVFRVTAPSGPTRVAWWVASGTLNVATRGATSWTVQALTVPANTSGVVRTDTAGNLAITWYAAGGLYFASQASG